MESQLEVFIMSIAVLLLLMLLSRQLLLSYQLNNEQKKIESNYKDEIFNINIEKNKDTIIKMYKEAMHLIFSDCNDTHYICNILHDYNFHVLQRTTHIEIRKLKHLAIDYLALNYPNPHKHEEFYKHHSFKDLGIAHAWWTYINKDNTEVNEQKILFLQTLINQLQDERY